MITAKLIKDLEKEGFELEFPSYISNENRIIDILRSKNERLYLAIPLLLEGDFDYEKIKKKLKEKKLKSKFDKTILITNKIFQKENIDNKKLKKTISTYNIKEKTSKDEFEYYYSTYKDSSQKKEEEKQEIFKEQTKLRSKLNTNLALQEIFAPGKRRIMDKIFNHEPLTNTELKYYYRSIRPLILAILNDNLQDYVRIIEDVKKYRE